jgi:hypothetical protein
MGVRENMPSKQRDRCSRYGLRLKVLLYINPVVREEDVPRHIPYGIALDAGIDRSEERPSSRGLNPVTPTPGGSRSSPK